MQQTSTPSTDKTKTSSKLEQQKSVWENGKGGMLIFTKLYSSYVKNCNMQYMCIIYVWSHPTTLHCNLLTKGGENNTIHIQYINNTKYNTTNVHTKKENGRKTNIQYQIKICN